MKRMLAIIMAVTVFTACKKNNTAIPAPVTPALAKVKTWTSGPNTATYTYDAQGRLEKYINTDGSKVEMEYQPGIVTKKVYNTGGIFQYSYKYELNASGLVAKTTLSNNANYQILEQYNADNTLAKSTSKINGTNNVADFFYSNGNCDSVRFTGNNGNWSSTVVKTFYSDKINVLTDANTGDNFYGKENKNMLKTEVYKYPDGTTNTMATFTYEYDQLGRVSKQTGTQGANISINLITYY